MSELLPCLLCLGLQLSDFQTEVLLSNINGGGAGPESEFWLVSEARLVSLFPGPTIFILPSCFFVYCDLDFLIPVCLDISC